MKKASKNEITLIAREYRSGKSLVNIGLMIGRSNTYVKARLKEAGVPLRPCSAASVDERELKSIARAYNAGKRIVDIADDFGKSITTIQNRLHIAGVTMRRGSFKSPAEKQPARAHYYFYHAAKLNEK